MVQHRTQQGTSVSPGAKQILKQVAAAGSIEQSSLNLKGSGKRTLAALQQGRLLRERIEKTTVLELTEAGRRLMQGREAGKFDVASGGRAKRRGEATVASKRGRRPDEQSARARAEPIIAKFKGPRKGLIALLTSKLDVTPASASTMIYNAQRKSAA